MATQRPITKEELQEIRTSVMEAVRRTIIAGTAQGRGEKRLRKQKGYTLDHFNADVLLENLRFSPRPDFGDSEVKDVVTKAAERDDKRFFIRLGKVLARKPVERPDGLSFRVPRLLEQFLIGQWMEPYNKDIPALFYLSEDGLAAVCSFALGQEVSVDTVVALRKRLGLKAFRRQKIKVISVGGKLKLQ